MTERQRLPNRRGSETFAFHCEGDGQEYTATASFFDDGTIGELFISTSIKAGSGVDLAAKDAAILCSLALQYGAPLDVIRKALQRDHLGRTATPVGAALDQLARGAS